MRDSITCLGSPWLNLKVGKFELDNIVSEKRGLTLSANGGGFQLYHFIPVGDSNFVGQIGDNQFGLEWMGHSANDRTRISASRHEFKRRQRGPAGKQFLHWVLRRKPGLRSWANLEPSVSAFMPW